MKKQRKFALIFCLVLLIAFVFGTTAYAAPTGDVAGAIEGTWR
ncbi:MAG TPA: hypothetical protein DEB10_03180, partial [Ruminococcaceae bacterium]|nr:hypothetical protein [Oscillospiraceae bacterium]